ncbi:MAG: transposase [Francisellaceae bacterium]|nr:transposase [Francisellaceae bacterium]
MKRKKWSNKIKFKIVVEGLRSDVNIADLCTKYGVHQSQYYTWRDQFLREGEKVFQSKDADKREKSLQKEMDKMEQVIGKLTLELKKND